MRMAFILVAVLIGSVSCAGSQNPQTNSAAAPPSESPKPAPTESAEAVLLTPKWVDGDVFVVERDFVKKDAVNDRQTRSVCKYNLEVEKTPEGYRIRQSGLLPGPLPVGSSNEEVNDYFGLLTCLVGDILVDEHFSYTGYVPVSYLPKIREAMLVYYAQPKFEAGLGDLVVEGMLSERMIEQKTMSLWGLLIQRWKGASLEALDGKVVPCADGTECLDFKYVEKLDAEAMGAGLNAKVTILGGQNSTQVITSLDKMYPEFLQANTVIRASVEPPDGRVVQLDAVGSDTYRITKVRQAPDDVYANMNGLTEEQKSIRANKLPDAFWACTARGSGKGKYRINIGIRADGTVRDITPLRELPSGVNECIQEIMKKAVFPKLSSDSYLIITFGYENEAP